MEKKKRRNRASGATPVNRTQSRKEKGEPGRSTGEGRKSSSGVRNDPGALRASSSLGALNIPLNPETARQAVILSEIIGKPVSKRKK